jgi:hypothetical protein
MSRTAQAVTLHALSTALGPRLGLWARTRGHFAGLTAAHARQARFSCQMEEISRDSSLPVEDVLGDNTYDRALTFFFQRNFDQH